MTEELQDNHLQSRFQYDKSQPLALKTVKKYTDKHLWA